MVKPIFALILTMLSLQVANARYISNADACGQELFRLATALNDGAAGPTIQTSSPHGTYAITVYTSDNRAVTYVAEHDSYCRITKLNIQRMR